MTSGQTRDAIVAFVEARGLVKDDDLYAHMAAKPIELSPSTGRTYIKRLVGEGRLVRMDDLSRPRRWMGHGLPAVNFHTPGFSP